MNRTKANKLFLVMILVSLFSTLASAQMWQRRSWPECVGMSGHKAKSYIENNFYGSVYIVPFGMMVTMDYRTDRVRIFVNRKGIV